MLSATPSSLVQSPGVHTEQEFASHLRALPQLSLETTPDVSNFGLKFSGNFIPSAHARDIHANTEDRLLK